MAIIRKLNNIQRLAYINLIEEETDYLTLVVLIAMHMEKRETATSSHWYDVCMKEYDEIQFRSTFRMSKECLDFIIKKFIEVSKTKNTIHLIKTFHMLIYYSMYNISYRALSEKFGEHLANTFRNVTSLLSKFNRTMGYIFIKRPGINELSTLAQKFLNISNIRGTILAIDGTHIPIEAPNYMDSKYINRKGWYSVSYQLVVDSDYIIRDVFGGLPGSCHDGYLYSMSSFKEYVDNEIPSPYFVIGDAAYPDSETLATPFKGTLSPDAELYNNRLSIQRMRVECTIGRLKGRFRRFMSRNKHGEQPSGIKIFHFACIIHNIIELFNLDSANDYYEEYLEIIRANPELDTSVI